MAYIGYLLNLRFKYKEERHTVFARVLLLVMLTAPGAAFAELYGWSQPFHNVLLFKFVFSFTLMGFLPFAYFDRILLNEKVKSA